MRRRIPIAFVLGVLTSGAFGCSEGEVQSVSSPPSALSAEPASSFDEQFSFLPATIPAGLPVPSIPGGRVLKEAMEDVVFRTGEAGSQRVVVLLYPADRTGELLERYEDHFSTLPGATEASRTEDLHQWEDPTTELAVLVATDADDVTTVRIQWTPQL